MYPPGYPALEEIWSGTGRWSHHCNRAAQRPWWPMKHSAVVLGDCGPEGEKTWASGYNRQKHLLERWRSSCSVPEPADQTTCIVLCALIPCATRCHLSQCFCIEISLFILPLPPATVSLTTVLPKTILPLTYFSGEKKCRPEGGYFPHYTDYFSIGLQSCAAGGAPLEDSVEVVVDAEPWLLGADRAVKSEPINSDLEFHHGFTMMTSRC